MHMPTPSFVVEMADEMRYPEIAAALERAREARGISQETAAHELGVSITTYGRWARGERQPRAAAAQLIAELWGVELDVLRRPRVVADEGAQMAPSVGEAVSGMRASLDRVEQLIELLLREKGYDVEKVARGGAQEPDLVVRDETGDVVFPVRSVVDGARELADALEAVESAPQPKAKGRVPRRGGTGSQRAPRS